MSSPRHRDMLSNRVMLSLGAVAFVVILRMSGSIAAGPIGRAPATATAVTALTTIDMSADSESASPPLEMTRAAICSRPEFSPAGPRMDVALFIFAWRRRASLDRLMTSLANAEYCGFNVSLTFLLDVHASPGVLEYAHNFHWAHGRKRVVDEPPLPPAEGRRSPHCLSKLRDNKTAAVECQGRGIRGMWVDVMGRELAAHESPTAHPLPIEDDIEVSPLYYWWLRWAAKAYGPFDTPASAWHLPRKLVGVSLYAPRLDEIAYPNRRWAPRRATAAGKAPAFLFCLPCSWGALYFRSQWEAFLRFYRTRAYPPFYHFAQEAVQKGERAGRETLGDPAIAIADSRASKWPRSWKRFMIDFMYGRGDVMLYPNGPRDPSQVGAALSFSTTYAELGAHTGTDGKTQVAKRDALRSDKEYDKRKTVPLVSWSDAATTLAAYRTAPEYTELAVISLHHQRVSQLSDLADQGRGFVTAGKTTARGTADEYDALMRAWLSGGQ